MFRVYEFQVEGFSLTIFSKNFIVLVSKRFEYKSKISSTLPRNVLTFKNSSPLFLTIRLFILCLIDT